MGRGHIWQALIGIAISIAALVWALWDVDFGEIVQHVREANPLWFLLSVLVVTATFPLRAFRWKVLLRASAPDAGLKPLWHATAIGFMANNVLPARAGELVRCYAANRLVGIPFTTALASVAVERVFDGVVIIFLLALAVASPSFPGGAEVMGTRVETLAATMAALFLGALIFLIILVRMRDKAEPVGERIIRKILPGRMGGAAARIFHNLLSGLGVLTSMRDVIIVVVWSFAIWLCNAGSYVLAFKAFNLDLPATAALALQGVVAIGVAVPQAPGFFGGFEALCKIVLGLYAVGADRAVGFAIAVHMGWWLPITLIGLILLARTSLSLRELRGEPART